MQSKICASLEIKAKTIVVLDDAVTSFDSNRITATHREIVELSDYFRQVIVLTHFQHSVATFLLRYHANENLAFLELEREEFERKKEEILREKEQKAMEKQKLDLSPGYKIRDPQGIYFVTFTVVEFRPPGPV